MAVVSGSTTRDRYSGFAVALHWLTAGLVAALFGLAQLWDLAGRQAPLRVTMQAWHISLGVCLALVLAVRLGWRVMRPGPAAAGHDGPLGWVARAMHWGLYALLCAAVGLGFVVRWSGTHPVSLFGLFDIPALVSLGSVWAHRARDLHGLAANTIMIVAGLHAAAALFHHYVLNDDVLRRMLPRRAGGLTPAAGFAAVPSGSAAGPIRFIRRVLSSQPENAD